MNKFVFDPTRKFLNPEKVLFAAGLGRGQIFADLGSGSGFYSVAASKIVGPQGMVYSFDVLESALDHVTAEARLHGARNIRTQVCNLEDKAACTSLEPGSADMVLLGNVLHQVKKRDNLFVEAYRLLKTGGKLLILEWNDQPAAIGPVADQRIAESEVAKLANKATFKVAGNLNVDPYHYGLIFIK